MRVEKRLEPFNLDLALSKAIAGSIQVGFLACPAEHVVVLTFTCRVSFTYFLWNVTTWRSQNDPDQYPGRRCRLDGLPGLYIVVPLS